MDKYQTYLLSIDEQIQELSSQGIEYANINIAKDILLTIGSYNINVYTFSYDKSKHKEFKYFGDKVDIIDIYRLYNFDSELRNIVIDIATNIEMKFKVYIGNYIGSTYGANGHRIEENFYNTSTFNNFVNNIVDRKNKEPTIYYCSSSDKEFYSNTHNFPVWLVCQQLTLGELSKMYGNLQDKIKESIIKENYNNKDVTKNWKSVKGWLKGVTDMRNICAHNNKLFDWKSTFKNPFALPETKVYAPFKINRDSLFIALIISKLLMNDKYDIKNDDWSIFVDRLKKCIDNYSSDNSDFDPLIYMGFPTNWKDILS